MSSLSERFSAELTEKVVNRPNVLSKVRLLSERRITFETSTHELHVNRLGCCCRLPRFEYVFSQYSQLDSFFHGKKSDIFVCSLFLLDDEHDRLAGRFAQTYDETLSVVRHANRHRRTSDLGGSGAVRRRRARDRTRRCQPPAPRSRSRQLQHAPTAQPSKRQTGE
jgi:hypothetical protein